MDAPIITDARGAKLVSICTQTIVQLAECRQHIKVAEEIAAGVITPERRQELRQVLAVAHREATDVITGLWPADGAGKD